MNSIHVKLDHDEAIALKKDALIIEKELLETIGYIRKYNELRKKEFLLKTQIKRNLTIMSSDLVSFEAHLPVEELGIIAKKQNTTPIVRQIVRHEPRVIERKQNDIEKEITDIREKLARLG